MSGASPAPPPTTRMRSSSELLEESEVRFVEEADGVDVVLQPRHSFATQTPRVAVPLRRIDAAVAQDLRMDHAAATDLEPSFVPAALAACAGAYAAGHVELEAWLGEREVARAHSHLAFFAVKRLDHVQQRALHVADGEGFVHGQPFDLAEVRQPGRFGRIAPVAADGRDDVDRRLLDTLHGPDLHRRGVRP